MGFKRVLILKSDEVDVGISQLLRIFLSDLRCGPQLSHSSIMLPRSLTTEGNEI